MSVCIGHGCGDVNPHDLDQSTGLCGACTRQKEREAIPWAPSTRNFGWAVRCKGCGDDVIIVENRYQAVDIMGGEDTESIPLCCRRCQRELEGNMRIADRTPVQP